LAIGRRWQAIFGLHPAPVAVPMVRHQYELKQNRLKTEWHNCLQGEETTRQIAFYAMKQNGFYSFILTHIVPALFQDTILKEKSVVDDICSTGWHC
jgi:hypothetical protein